MIVRMRGFMVFGYVRGNLNDFCFENSRGKIPHCIGRWDRGPHFFHYQQSIIMFAVGIQLLQVCLDSSRKDELDSVKV